MSATNHADECRKCAFCLGHDADDPANWSTKRNRRFVAKGVALAIVFVVFMVWSMQPK